MKTEAARTDRYKEMNLCACDQLMGDLFSIMTLDPGACLLHAIRAIGVDIDIADQFGRNLLTHAVEFAPHCRRPQRRRIEATMSLLLQNHADVNRADVRGETAFSLALKLWQRDIAQVLFNHGADFPSRIN